MNGYVEGLVSIITPVYNSAKYIRETIESVRKQTYRDWEMILVDDCSSDHSAVIIKEIAEKDTRVRYIRLDTNCGAAVARNVALENAGGQYIAYLDADDVWFPEKLDRQIAFIKQHGVQFTCCDYEKIEADGSTTHKVVHMPKTITYEQLLRNTVIQTVGVIVDLSAVDRKLLVMPNIRRGQDSATWLQILRDGVKFVGQREVLAQYRRSPQSLSSNKIKAMKRTWNLYRNVEHLSLLKSCHCLVGWAYHATLKRIYIEKIFSKQEQVLR